MVVAVLDDLMFSSKLRGAAAAAGVTLQFARTREAALTLVREQPPALVIVDLDNPRTDPLGLLAEWRRQPETAAIRVLGFVSHVRADLIADARAAGISEVLARSAFVQRLPQLMTRAAGPEPAPHSEADASSSDEPPPRE